MTGNTWTELSDGSVDQSSPVTDVLMTALRDNPKAIAERAANAPIVRIAQPTFLSGSGSWVVPTGVTAFKVTVVGGGGAGGAAAGTPAVAGSGGGHGAVAIKWYNGVTPGASYSYSVGAGGASAGSHTQISNSGGTTTFDTLSAGGGGGGYGSAVAGAPQTVLSGSASGGDINTRSHLHQQIHGSSGFYGQGGANPSPSNGVGEAGQGYGAGGGGAYDTDSNGDLGGAGAPGTIIIEY